MVAVVDFFLIVGLILLIGFFGRAFRNRTGIPESLFLILLGILLGPVLGIFDPALLIGFIPTLSVFALAIILLEASTSLNISSLFRSVGRSVLFSILTAFLVTLFITLSLIFLLGYEFQIALIIGLISSGTTTITVLALLDRLHASKPVKDLLMLESIVNDFTAIVGTFLVLDFLRADGVDLTAASQSLFGEILAALTAGFVAALVWQRILSLTGAKKELSYMSTLGAAFVVYYLGFLFGANPILTLFVFGLSLANLGGLAKLGKWKLDGLDSTLRSIRTVQPDISFFVRTFFFVLLGVIFNPQSITLSLVLAAAIIIFGAMLMRYVSSTLLGRWDPLFIENRTLITTMIPRGFAATILSFVPQQYGVEIPYLTDLVLLLVFSTTLVAILGTAFLSRPSPATTKKSLPNGAR